MYFHRISIIFLLFPSYSCHYLLYFITFYLFFIYIISWEGFFVVQCLDFARQRILDPHLFIRIDRGQFLRVTGEPVQDQISTKIPWGLWLTQSELWFYAYWFRPLVSLVISFVFVLSFAFVLSCVCVPSLDLQINFIIIQLLFLLLLFSTFVLSCIRLLVHSSSRIIRPLVSFVLTFSSPYLSSSRIIRPLVSFVLSNYYRPSFRLIYREFICFLSFIYIVLTFYRELSVTNFISGSHVLFICLFVLWHLRSQTAESIQGVWNTPPVVLRTFGLPHSGFLLTAHLSTFLYGSTESWKRLQRQEATRFPTYCRWPGVPLAPLFQSRFINWWGKGMFFPRSLVCLTPFYASLWLDVCFHWPMIPTLINAMLMSSLWSIDHGWQLHISWRNVRPYVVRNR